MSISGSSDEFAYRTRLVVYNFLGLVPAAPSQSDDDAEGSQPEQQQQQLPDARPPSPWNNDLGTLPTLSLIDRLSESEDQQMRMRMVCDEVADRVRRVEPVSSDQQPSRGTSEEPSKDARHRNKRYEKLDFEKVHEAVLNELRQKVPDRSRSPNDWSSEEMAAGTITIIQKRNKLKILGESITSVEEADIRRRLSLPVSTTARSSEIPFGRSSAQPHSAQAGAGFPFGGRTSAARRPTTLLSSSTPSAEMALGPSREILSQIDEEHESDETNGRSFDEDGPEDGASDRDAPMSASAASVSLHFTPRPSAVLTPISIERQSSSRSGSSRRCSTYIDITEVDVESLVKSRTLPSVTVPLKRELSIAFEELEKSHQTGDDTFGSGLNATMGDLARTPESEVADSLRALGDRIQEEYGSRLNSIVQDILGSNSSSTLNYNTVQNLTSQLLQQTQQGWTRVALVMLLGQHLVYELLRQGYTGIGHMAEYTAKLLEDHTADFIINNGGWNSISDIGVTETEASLSSSGIDYRLIPEFNCSSGDGMESYFGRASTALSEATPFSNSVASESFQETFYSDDQMQVDSIHEDVSKSSSAEPSMEVCSPSADLQDRASLHGITVSTPPDADQPTDQSIDGDIVLLRQNSLQYMDETESARRTVVLTQSGAFVGLALLTLLASWLIYQRFRRVA